MARTDLRKEVKTILSEQTDFMKPLLQGMLQQLLEEQMNHTLGVISHERSPGRRGYRAG